MSDSDLLHFLTARLTARENAMIYFTAIASSASLIFLGVAIENITKENLETIPEEYIFLGIVIPTIAFVHFELTRLGIQKNDHKKINELLKKSLRLSEWQWNEIKDKTIQYDRFRKCRRFLANLLFLSPVIAWFWVIPYKLNMSDGSQLVFDILSFVIVICIVLWRMCVDDMPKKCEND